jgi:alginate O-acetyltransferase complex protein AlgI
LLFSSPLFLFFFLPVFAVCYAVAPRAAKNTVILAGSLFFYGWAEPRFIFAVIASSLLDYMLAAIMTKSAHPRTKLACLWMGIVANIGLLFYFKYANFLLQNLSPLFRAANLSTPVLEILLPIGVSFIVFEKITYVVDVYKGVGKASKSFLSYLTYVFFFPKLLAGPIIKYHDIANQFSQRTHRLRDVEAGFLLFLAGLAKKVLIADCLAAYADGIFKAGGDAVGSYYAWVGVICFTLQIYYDFSGYSDMAIGMSRMMGFHLRDNFNMPYVARSFSDFWHRWHLSLSSWIREYLYIPLGGNRVGPGRRHFNLWLCFLLSGLWHGASWTFVCWGAIHGIGLIIDKMAWLKLEQRLPKPLTTATTLLCVMLGWVFFRAETFGQAGEMIRALFSFQPPQEFVYVSKEAWFMMAVGSLFAFVRPVDLYKRGVRAIRRFELGAGAIRVARNASVLALLFVCVMRASGNSFHPFLYFRF